MTTRRDLVLALPLLSAASHIKAQQPTADKPKRIGLISDRPSNVPATDNPAWRPFWNALYSKGWVLGKNLVFGPEYRERDPKRLAAFAERLVLDSVDLIVCVNEEPTLAAMRATQSIPILFLYVAWPMELGVIDSLAHPGRNATGQAYMGVEMNVKRIEYLRKIAPDAKRLSVIWGEPSWSYQTLAGGQFDLAAAFDAGIKRLGFEPRYHLAPTTQDIDAAFGEVAAWRAQVVSVTGRSMSLAREQVAQLALRQRLPSAGQHRQAVEAGTLLALWLAPSEEAALDIRAADLADRLLRGANPADLPVELPSRYELVINLKTANALGVTIPQELLIRADELIQ